MIDRFCIARLSFRVAESGPFREHPLLHRSHTRGGLGRENRSTKWLSQYFLICKPNVEQSLPAGRVEVNPMGVSLLFPLYLVPL